ncbi:MULTISPECIES: BlaI/MecI/CopY family transcriptional regulator [unclassified Lentilitoribacter]|jgi:BlaI family penicillinase repressor|uniref:BlaI/MecI/CopY family transcriptional regulator n=1 Tax=unclassified Lentilitoribacter TaxID=2647570 RepID=UPI0013A70004|nr:BlaI/MecI/CopY family transcriptional regulator [Lentilitoribacter sp. Alg239-R112]
MKSEKLSKSELEVMVVLWSLGKGTASDIQQELNNDDHAPREYAYTTIATHLNRMVEKGAVKAKKKGRSYEFEPLESRSDFGRFRLAGLLDQFFDGRASSLASQFIEANTFTEKELNELEALIAEKKSK